MSNPESLRNRIRTNLQARRMKTLTPPLAACQITIEVVAQALNTTPDEISRKIELSPMKLQPRFPDVRQMNLFPDPIAI